MILKRFLVVLVLLLSYSYSYCETITGTTPNAASFGTTWAMTNLLPQATGITLRSINYSYTVSKEVSDQYSVELRNLNSTNTGYVFRNLDDWTGRPGNTLVKSVVPQISSASQWGQGQIYESGQGTLSNVSVKYSYMYDTCAQKPLVDPACPGYASKYTIPTVGDPLSDPYLLDLLARKYVEPAQEQQKPSLQKSKKAVAKITVPGTIPQEMVGLEVELLQLNNIAGFKDYSRSIPGGVYKDTIGYATKSLPDNRAQRRLGLAQEQLHNKLVDSQYVKE